MRTIAIFVIFLSVFSFAECLLSTECRADSAVTGSFTISGYSNGDSTGVCFLEGNLEGVDSIVVFDRSGKNSFISFGSVAPPEMKWNHVYCDLNDFFIKVELDTFASNTFWVEGFSKSKQDKVVTTEIGKWSWTVDDSFELNVHLGEKSEGCFTDGICGNSHRIYGPFCDPCEMVLCCYGDHGFINCGNFLCP